MVLTEENALTEAVVEVEVAMGEVEGEPTNHVAFEIPVLLHGGADLQLVVISTTTIPVAEADVGLTGEVDHGLDP